MLLLQPLSRHISSLRCSPIGRVVGTTMWRSMASSVATATPSVASVVPTLGLPDKFGLFINGEFVEPTKGEYFDNVSPIDGSNFIQAGRGTAEDIDKAIEAAHQAYNSHWSKASVTERSNMLLKIADIIEANADRLAKIETVDNGKAVRETTNADIPLVIDHFRYFAGCIRAEEGTASELDKDTLSLCIQEPLGVVGQIIPWNFPLLMAAWKLLAPALAAGNCVVLKPAEQTPTSNMVLTELIKDVVPSGVLNVVTGFGNEAGAALASHKKIAKVAFTGSTTTGSSILHAAAENLIPATMESLGGKSPNIFVSSVMDKDDEFLDKAVEGAVLAVCLQSRGSLHLPVSPSCSRRYLRTIYGQGSGTNRGHCHGRSHGPSNHDGMSTSFSRTVRSYHELPRYWSG